MKKICIGAAMIGAFFVLTGCVSGAVTDKRAPGVPGRKTFQISIDDDRIPGNNVWITVSEKDWDDCGVGMEYPACTEGSRRVTVDVSSD